MPIGPARQAEIHPASASTRWFWRSDGCFGLVAIRGRRAVLPARRVSRTPAAAFRATVERHPPSTVAAPTSRHGWTPLVAGMGIRFGSGSGSRTGGGAHRRGHLTTHLAVGAVVAALTFGASLGQSDRESPPARMELGRSRRQSEQHPGPRGPDGTDSVPRPLVAAYSAIAILAGAGQGNVVIDGRTVDSLLAFDPLKGSVYPPLLDGHPPRQPNQVVFGTRRSRHSTDAWANSAGQWTRRQDHHGSHRWQHDLTVGGRPLHQQHWRRRLDIGFGRATARGAGLHEPQRSATSGLHFVCRTLRAWCVEIGGPRRPST